VEVGQPAAGGSRVLNSGSVADGVKGPVEPGAHFYRSLVLDEHGNQINKRSAWAGRSVAYVRLITPGAADTFHYRLQVPQRVETAQFIRLSGQPDPNGRDLTIRDREHGLAEAEREDVRLFALFLDDYHIDSHPEVTLRLKRALESFVDSLQPTDLWSISTFDSMRRTMIGWRPYNVSIVNSLRAMPTSGSTELFKSVADMVPFMKDTPHRKRAMLLMTDGNTKLYLVEPSPAGFKPLASAVILEPGDNWAPLALVDGKLLVRGQKELKALQVAQ
jgi:hypothetical protein